VITPDFDIYLADTDGTRDRFGVMFGFCLSSGGVLPVNENHRITICLLILVLAVTTTGYAQESASWHDPSKHSVQFVTVEEGVRLEVLDWERGGQLCCWQGSDSPRMFSTVLPRN
jgi:hypothetical protein